MNNYVFAVVAFFFLIVIVELMLYSWRVSRDLRRSKKVVARLRVHTLLDAQAHGADNILKTRTLSAIPLLNTLLLKINLVGRIETLVKQAQAPYTPVVYMLLSALLGLIGFMAGSTQLRSMVLRLLVGFACCLLPFAFLNVKKSLRLKKFTAQLPDALDLIARSLKAGHSFSSGLNLAAENFPDPLGVEFMTTINEINFGMPVAEALKNLGKRVDCPDLNFFIIATILQRETGGNLAEITQTIASLIRERFKFEDKVRVLAAEGKISAVILIALPICMFLYLLKMSPEYMHVLLDDPLGRKAGVAAIAMMIVGIIIIMRMVRIKI